MLFIFLAAVIIFTLGIALLGGMNDSNDGE
jgi:hypothetical protein